MSTKYHKILTVWRRDPETKFRALIDGEWAAPEFELLAELEWVWTEKVDGTNIRVIWDPGMCADDPAVKLYPASVEFRGRTDNAQLPPHLLKALQEHFTTGWLEAALKGPCTLYGEGYGVKIQKGGGDYRKDAGFILFDVWAGCWLERATVEEIALALNVPVVPIVGRGPLRDAIEAARSGFESRLRPTAPEGLVMRPPLELSDRLGNRIITKIKLKDFR